MTNREIAKSFQLLGQLMELHDGNPFKVRSYMNAYLTIRKLPEPLSQMKIDDIRSLKGVGKAISEKIRELLSTGQMQALEGYKQKTPPGLVELMGLKGFGPKKIRQVWEKLGIESGGELLYACQENRLVDLKGFGIKTQEALKSDLEYFMKSSGKFLYAQVEEYAFQVVSEFKAKYPGQKFRLSGEIKRFMPVIEKIELDCLVPTKDSDWNGEDPKIDFFRVENQKYFYHDIPVEIRKIPKDLYVLQHVKNTSSRDFYEELQKRMPNVTSVTHSEEDLFHTISSPLVPAELREDPRNLYQNEKWFDSIITEKQIKGVVHTHTTYSDGMNTIEEMALKSLDLGYEYIVISDHSKSAFYANGLTEDRLIEQWAEIDRINEKLPGIRIFKSIESDILYDGSLDYESDILKNFDLVIASVHSNLKMDEEKANARLISAIENPYTKILGHMTGRLLLSRQGYPVDHRKIIEACAENAVVIELNANPHRLDIDWTWIQYALEKDVIISINPDAHNTKGILDTRFGVLVARKAGLPVHMCLNAKDTISFEQWLSQ